MVTFRRRSVACLFALVLVAGCASTSVTNRQVLVGNEKLPRPNRIWVYYFAATPKDVPPDSAFAAQIAESNIMQSAEEVEAGRELGAEIASELVAQIKAMGLPAAHATRQTVPGISDLVIRGYLLSVDEGSATKRVTIGFGAGASELKTAVEGYQMTATGLRKLGSGTVASGGSKGPGAAAPATVAIASGNPIGLIVSGGMKIYGEASSSAKLEGRAKATAQEIAEQLKTRFEQQGWIK